MHLQDIKIAILFLILFFQHEDGATGFSKTMVNSYRATPPPPKKKTLFMCNTVARLTTFSVCTV
jgi:hypothetical protein